MKITVSAVHFAMQDSLESFSVQKVEKLCSKFSEDVLNADVTLKLGYSDTGENKTAGIRLEMRGESLFAEKTSSTFEESVDLAVDALKKQLERYKQKTCKKC